MLGKIESVLKINDDGEIQVDKSETQASKQQSKRKKKSPQSRKTAVSPGTSTIQEENAQIMGEKKDSVFNNMTRIKSAKVGTYN